MQNRLFFSLLWAVVVSMGAAQASTFLLLEPSYGKYGKGLQISYFDMDGSPGFKPMLGVEIAYLTVENSKDDLDGSLFTVSPGLSLRYLTPVWLMPEFDFAMNLGYESYTENCDGDCPEENGWIIGTTMRQKLLLVPSFRFSPVIGAGLFETYNFYSKLYPYDYGVSLSAGIKF